MFQKIGQQKVYLEILEQFKQLILSGELTVGSRLPSERQMAEEMNISRTTIREAVRALELIGVVRCVQGEGNFLTDNLNLCMVEPLSILFLLGGKDVCFVQQLRYGLEIQTARLAAKNINDEQAAELEQIVFGMETSDDPEERAELDRKFHYLIADISGNPLITSILNSAETLINHLISDIRTMIINDSENSELISNQHKQIVAALKAHTLAASAAAMEEHMKLVSALLEKIIP